jgi:hypothetical protein
MLKLLQKVVKVFLRHPILWLPYICAYLLEDGLRWLQGLANREIFTWYLTGHSIWSGSDTPFSSASASVYAARMDRVLFCGADYIYGCIWAFELVVTAILVSIIFRAEPLAWRSVAAAARGYWKRILGYSAKLWVLSMALMALASVSAIFLAMPTANRPASIIFLYTKIQIVVGILCYGWIMAPMSIRLLRPADSPPVTAVEKRQGRWFVILAAIAAQALSLLLHPLLQAMSSHASKAAYTIAIDSIQIVLSFPILLATIAIVLIAIGGEPLADSSTPRIDLRKYLRTVMPLHYGQGERIADEMRDEPHTQE